MCWYVPRTLMYLHNCHWSLINSHYDGLIDRVSLFFSNFLPASRRCQRSHLQCSSFTVQRTRWSTSLTASPFLSAAPRPWNPSGWREPVTTTLSFTVSTWRGYGASSTRTWLHSMPEKQTTASLCLYEWIRVRRVCMFMCGEKKRVRLHVWVSMSEN